MTNCSSSGGRSDENDVLDFNRSRCVGVDRRRVDQEAVSDLLESCNDGPSKAAIVDFVTRVTAVGGPDYVSKEQRIATFDNDGTLWSEQPLYPVPQNAPCVSAGLNVLNSPRGKCPKATDVSPWYGVYFQLAFAIDRVKAVAPSHPEWKNQEPFKRACSNSTRFSM